MTAFDYVLLVLLIGSMLISLTRGLVREVISLASWIVAFYVAINYGEMLAPWLSADFQRNGENHSRFCRVVPGDENCHDVSCQTGQSGIAGDGIDFHGSFAGGIVRTGKRCAHCTGTGSGMWHDENTAAAFLAKCDVFAGGRIGGKDDHAVFAGLFCGIHSLLIAYVCRQDFVFS